MKFEKEMVNKKYMMVVDREMFRDKPSKKYMMIVCIISSQSLKHSNFVRVNAMS